MCWNFDPASPFIVSDISAIARFMEGLITVFVNKVTVFADLSADEIALSIEVQEATFPPAVGYVKRSPSYKPRTEATI